MAKKLKFRLEGETRDFNSAINSANQALFRLTEQSERAATNIVNLNSKMRNLAQNIGPRFNKILKSSATDVSNLRSKMSALNVQNEILISSTRETADRMQRIGPAAQKAANSIKIYTAASQKAQAQSKETSNTILVSWKSIARIFAIQQLHLVISQITFALQDAARASIEFQRKIAEVQTISQGQGVSFREWSEQVRNLGIQFGQTGADVAEAAYQSLSNQVVQGAETFAFLQTALKFSRAAVTDSATSVNLLTAAINSFGLETADADRVAGILFKTIELGRVRAEDMAGTFGRLGRIASLAGVSLEETAAAIQTMTIQGIRFDRASTFIINFVRGLIKPSEELTGVLERLGFETGQQALESLGLAGTLRQLDNEIRGNTKRLAELFPNLRGLQGVAGLTGDSFSKLADNIQKTIDAGDSFDKAAELTFKTAGDKITRAINEVQIVFERALGTIQETVVRVSELLGVDLANAFINVAKVAGVLAAGAGVAASIAGLKALALAAGTTTAALLGPVGLAAGLAAVAASFILFSDNIEEASKRTEQAFIESNKKILDTQLRAANDQKRAVENVLKEQDRLVALSASRQRAPIIESLKLQQEAIKQTNNRIKIITADATEAFRQSIKILKDEIKDLDSIINNLDTTVSRIQESTRNQIFQLRFDDATPQKQLKLIDQEIERLRAKAQNLTSPTTESQREASRIIKQINALVIERFELAKRFNEQQTKLAERNLQIQKQITNEQSKTQQAREKATDQIARNLAQIAKLERSLGPRRVKRNPVAQQKEITRRANVVDRINQLEQRNLQIARSAVQNADQRLTKITDLRNKIKETTTLTVTRAETEERLLEIQKEHVALEKQRSKLAQERREAARKELEERKEQFRVAKQVFQTLLDTSLINRGKPVGVEEVNELIAKFDRERKSLSDSISLLDEQSQLTILDAVARKREELIKQSINLEKKERINANIEANKAIVQDFKNGLDSLNNAQVEQLQQLNRARAQLAGAQSQLEDNFFATTTASLQKLTDADIKKLKEIQAASSSPIRGSLNVDLNKISEILRTIPDRLTTDNVDEVVGEAQELLNILTRTNASDAYQKIANQALEASIDIFNARNAVHQFDQGIVDLAASISNSMQNTRGQIQLTTQELQKLINLSQQALQITRNRVSNAVPERRAHGGLAGKDTIPSLLQAGEFVMNSAATKRFRNQLMAMNFGTRRFAGGGEVSNTSVGAVNVSVQGGDTSEATIREIGKGLKRAIRRGVIKFNG